MSDVITAQKTGLGVITMDDRKCKCCGVLDFHNVWKRCLFEKTYKFTPSVRDKSEILCYECHNWLVDLVGY